MSKSEPDGSDAMEKTLPQNPPGQNNPRSIQTVFLRTLSDEPVLVGLNVLLLGGFLIYLLISNQPEQGLASGIQPPTQTQETLVTNTPGASSTPSATPTPTLVTPTLTQTAFPSPTSLPPTPLPKSGLIEDIKGHKQSLSLIHI